jgi:hypothetical protein
MMLRVAMPLKGRSAKSRDEKANQVAEFGLVPLHSVQFHSTQNRGCEQTGRQHAGRDTRQDRTRISV